jgi:hypothetical protein
VKGNRQFLIAALVAVAFVVGAVLGSRTDAVNNLFDDDTPASSEALDVISDRYFQDVQTDELENSSIMWFVKLLRLHY